MKSILITGGSSGIGAETAKYFARQNYKVAISYFTNKDGADSVVSDITKFGGTAVAFEADLSQESEAKNLVEFVSKKFGSIDIVVNNAGVYIDGDEWDGTDDIWGRTLETNLLSVMNVSKYCVRFFKQQREGVMVNVASRLGLSGSYEELAYGASKAGVINLTQAYAKLLIPHGRANSVSMGAVNAGYWLTAPIQELDSRINKNPSKTLIDKQDVVDAIFFLASDKAVRINGQNIILE